MRLHGTTHEKKQKQIGKEKVKEREKKREKNSTPYSFNVKLAQRNENNYLIGNYIVF